MLASPAPFDITDLPLDVERVIYREIDDETLVGLLRAALVECNLETLCLAEQDFVRRVARSPAADAAWQLIAPALHAAGPRIVRALCTLNIPGFFKRVIEHYASSSAFDASAADAIAALFSASPELVDEYWGLFVKNALEHCVRDRPADVSHVAYYLRTISRFRGSRTMDDFVRRLGRPVYYQGQVFGGWQTPPIPAKSQEGPDYFWDSNFGANGKTLTLLYLLAEHPSLIRPCRDLGLDLDGFVSDGIGRVSRIAYMLWWGPEDEYDIDFLASAAPYFAVTPDVISAATMVVEQWREGDFNSFDDDLDAARSRMFCRKFSFLGTHVFDRVAPAETLTSLLAEAVETGASHFVNYEGDDDDDDDDDGFPEPLALLYDYRECYGLPNVMPAPETEEELSALFSDEALADFFAPFFPDVAKYLSLGAEYPEAVVAAQESLVFRRTMLAFKKRFAIN